VEWIKVTTEEELKEAKAIRQRVFVQEQGVSEEAEQDEYDALIPGCIHILLLHEGKVVGTGRIRALPDGIGKLERICVLQQYRGSGAGAIITNALESIASEQGLTRAKLGGQIQAKGFYEKQGYAVISEPFMDEGIPHVMMEKKLG